MSVEITADAQLDCRGLLCPMPVVELCKKMKKLDSGQVLEVQIDGLGGKADIPAWCETTGNELVSCEPVDGVMTFLIRKVGAGIRA